MYISYVAKARLFTAVFSQLSIFTADCLRHPIQMVGVETIWELHTLPVINSCAYLVKLLGTQWNLSIANTMGLPPYVRIIEASV